MVAHAIVIVFSSACFFVPAPATITATTWRAPHMAKFTATFKITLNSKALTER